MDGKDKSIDENDVVNAKIGTFIKFHRKNASFSQKKLADHLNLTQQQIQKYENGKNSFSLKLLHKLAEVLSFSLTEILDELDGLDVSIKTLSESDEPLILDPLDEKVVNQFYSIPDVRLKQKILELSKLVREQPTLY